MGSTMLDRKMALYSIQVCGWKGNVGELTRDVTRGRKIRNKSQEASNMESAMLDRKMAIYSIPGCSHINPQNLRPGGNRYPTVT